MNTIIVRRSIPLALSGIAGPGVWAQRASLGVGMTGLGLLLISALGLWTNPGISGSAFPLPPPCGEAPVCSTPITRVYILPLIEGSGPPFGTAPAAPVPAATPPPLNRSLLRGWMERAERALRKPAASGEPAPESFGMAADILVVTSALLGAGPPGDALTGNTTTMRDLLMTVGLP